MPGGACENRRDNILLFDVALLINKDKKERFVLFDRSAEPAAELVSVLIVFLSADQVLKPALGRQHRVPVGIEQRSVEVVSAGTGLHPDLS